jgi:recombination protein RecA
MTISTALLQLVADNPRLSKSVLDSVASPGSRVLPLELPAVDAVLPGGGLPRAAVVEIASPRGLARATRFALAACASAQAEARRRSGDDRTEGAWCAWIDPGASLFAPGAAIAGVDLERLLVVRPPLEALARVAVRVAESRAMSAIVIDTSGIPGGSLDSRMDRWATVVRRLALAVEDADTVVLLLTDSRAARSAPLPVAMRIELESHLTRSEQGQRDRVQLRVAKDRRGRVGSPVIAAVA